MYSNCSSICCFCCKSKTVSLEKEDKQVNWTSVIYALHHFHLLIQEPLRMSGVLSLRIQLHKDMTWSSGSSGSSGKAALLQIASAQCSGIRAWEQKQKVPASREAHPRLLGSCTVATCYCLYQLDSMFLFCDFYIQNCLRVLIFACEPVLHEVLHEVRH